MPLTGADGNMVVPVLRMINPNLASDMEEGLDTS